MDDFIISFLSVRLTFSLSVRMRAFMYVWLYTMSCLCMHVCKYACMNIVCTMCTVHTYVYMYYVQVYA